MKLLFKFIILFLFVFLMYELLLYSSIMMNGIHGSLVLWSTKVVPSLLPFFLLSNFLMNYGLTSILSELFKPIMKLFKTNPNNAFIFVISIFTGSPSNAFFAKEAISNNLISDDDATKVLLFSHFSSPLFILGTVYSSLNNKFVCVLILIVTYLTNIILALLFRNKYISNDYSKISISNIKKNLNNKISFGKTLATSIHKTFDTLLIILGSSCFFNMISISIDQVIKLNDNLYAFLSGILEMTQGISNVCLLNIPLNIKALFISIFLSFGGFSIHSQILSIIGDTKIKYLPYFLARLIHAVISGTMVFILVSLIS